MGPCRSTIFQEKAVGNITSIAMEDQGDLGNNVRNTTFEYRWSQTGTNVGEKAVKGRLVVWEETTVEKGKDEGGVCVGGWCTSMIKWREDIKGASHM